MSSTSELLSVLENKTVTLGWDIVVAYDRNKVNQLFDQQYVEKVFNNENFTEINEKITSGLNIITLNNIKCGPPRISFENSKIEDSVAKARINLISGSIVTQDSSGRVVGREVITPALGYALELSVSLEQAKGSVENDALVQIKFEKAILLNVVGINNPPLEVMEYFRTWLKNNEVSYTLGMLNLDGAGILTPQEFRIRTQPAPGATLKSANNYGNGAVLLFIATKYNSKPGELPNNSYPYLLPDEHSCAVLLSSRVLFEHYFLTPFKNSLKGTTVGLGRVNENSDSSYIMKVSGKYDTGENFKQHVRFYNGASSEEGDLYSANNDGTAGVKDPFGGGRGVRFSETSAKIDMTGFTIKAAVDRMIFGWGGDHEFTQLIATDLDQAWMGGSQIDYRKYNADFKISNSNSYATFHVSEDFSVSINYDNINYDVDYSTDLIHDWIYDEGFKPLADGISKRAKSAIKTGLTPDISEVDLFVSANLLFPENNSFFAKDVYIPGDLVLFGDINPKKTAFEISPLESVVALNETVTFKVEPAKNVKWSITPDVGKIDSSGLYHAPAVFDVENLNVKVTAKDDAGSSASAITTLVPAPLILSPSLNVIIEGQAAYAASLQLKAVFSGQSQSLKWSLSEDIGSIDDSGLYMPPEKFAKGIVFIDAIATTQSGNTAKAKILLQSKNAIIEYSITPAIVKSMQPSMSQKFETVAIDDMSVVNRWVAYPDVGSFQHEEANEQEDETYLCTVEWVAPANFSEDQPVYIQAVASSPMRSGYAMVELVNKK